MSIDNGLFYSGEREPRFKGPRKRRWWKVYFVLNGVVLVRFFPTPAQAATFAANIRNRPDISDTTRPIEVL